MDVFVDASPIGWPSDVDVAERLRLGQVMSEQLVAFFKARQRGRIIYLYEDRVLKNVGVDGWLSTYQDRLESHIAEAAALLKDQAVTVNGVALGVTEDFILKFFSKSGSIKKSLVELQSKTKGVRLVEHSEIAGALAYLACPASSSVTGQILRLTYGLI
jgi:enoyl-[acyl-carrier-protein] reductase (NADH)